MGPTHGSNPLASCHGKRKTTSLQGEDALTSSHCKTINTNQEVKVCTSILSKTLPLPKAPTSPASKILGTPLQQMPPFPALPSPFFHHPEVQSPLMTSPHNVAQGRDIVVLKRGFPDSFDTIGNMPSTYTIRTDPSVPPVQHMPGRKSPIEYRDQIEKASDDMVLKGVIAPVTKPDQLCVFTDLSPASLMVPCVYASTLRT